MSVGYRISSMNLLLLAVVTGFTSVACEVQKATPIEKVVQLLKKLSAEIAEEGKVEAADYDKFACFCKEQADEKQYAIETATKKIDVAKAKEDDLKKSIAELNQEVSDLSKKISGLETDIKKATDKREGEASTYQKQAKDLNDAISACERAIEAMKESKENIDGKVDLAQLSASSPLLATALIAQASKQSPASYQYSSNEILGILDSLLGKFKANKAELDETEFNAKSAFELKKQDMSNQKTFAEKEQSEKEEQAESLSETLADTTETKNEETKAKEADEEFMKVLTSDCENKAGEFDQRSKARSDELTAITTALEDLQKNAMGNYEATGLTDLQTQKSAGKKAPSFLQLRSMPKASLLSKQTGASRFAATQSAIDLLLKKVEKTHSPVLASLAMKMTLSQQAAKAVGIDHFVKVRQLIKDLLKKLDEDAKSEATTKTYCDKNLKEQTTNRDTAKATIEQKAADIGVAEDELREAKEKIAELEEGIAKNLKALNEATELREEEKAANELTINMSEEGKKSVEFALSVLKEFYEKAAKNFLQKEAYTPPKADRSGQTVGDLAPKTNFSGKYGGNQEASKGIIGILEVIAADFKRTKGQAEKDEAAAVEKYKEMKKDTEDDNDAKNKEVKTNEKKVSDLKDKLISLADDKKAAEKNLASAEATLDDLKKMCIDGEETYEERKAKREEEIEALKQALEVFENWKN